MSFDVVRGFGVVSFARWALAIAIVLCAGCSSSGAPPSPTAAPTVAPSHAPTPAPTPTATATPTPTSTPTPAGFTIMGTPSTTYAKLDAEMQSFMQQNGIRAGQLSIGKAGTALFSHGYTNSIDPSYAIRQPTSIMRIASNSKALVTGAITKLYAAGTISPSTLVYPYLGVTQPLLSSQTPDPNANAITVQELVNHTAGLHNSDGSAPEFNMQSIEIAAGNIGPLTDAQFTAYLYGQPLYSVPGATAVYSNEGYYLLARVVEKATGQHYIDWINANLLEPIGIDDAVVSATALSGRRPNEVTYDDPSTGFSVLTPQAYNLVPDAYGGLYVSEVLDGPTTIAISAQSLAIYAGHYNVYGLGGHTPGTAREGSINGTSSWMESLPDGYDFSFIFNTRVDRKGNEFDMTPLTSYLEGNI
jgi:CubicO group peptidase (beta-lactamase class C family)